MSVSLLTSTLTVAGIAFSVLAHELAHGYVALWHGDDTARRAGRLTWNPVKHVDPFLSIILPLVTYIFSSGTVIIGGAKPLPVNPWLYQGNRLRADLRVSLAGVAANLLIAIACLVVGVVLKDVGGAWPVILLRVVRTVMIANVALIAFNLLPIPPLDGWRVFECVRRVWRRRARR